MQPQPGQHPPAIQPTGGSRPPYTPQQQQQQQGPPPMIPATNATMNTTIRTTSTANQMRQGPAPTGPWQQPTHGLAHGIMQQKQQTRPPPPPMAAAAAAAAATAATATTPSTRMLGPTPLAAYPPASVQNSIAQQQPQAMLGPQQPMQHQQRLELSQQQQRAAGQPLPGRPQQPLNPQQQQQQQQQQHQPQQFQFQPTPLARQYPQPQQQQHHVSSQPQQIQPLPPTSLLQQQVQEPPVPPRQQHPQQPQQLPPPHTAQMRQMVPGGTQHAHQLQAAVSSGAVAPQPRPALRPPPTQNVRPMATTTPVRPLPPQHSSNGHVAPSNATSSANAALASNAGAPPAKLTSSMMPRPCALEPPCGSARAFHHRGLVGISDQNQQGSYPAATIPSANTDFIAVDDGSARIRYQRLTTGAIAADPNVMSKSGVPLAVVLSPFADPAPGETQIPVVDLTSAGGGGPLRCERCFGYANPGFKFVNGGAQFHCNLCGLVNTTPAEHFSPVAPSSGLRMDVESRHEFRFGSVEYVVGSASYIMRPPKPACYIFAFDISSGAVASGLAASAVGSVKSALEAGMLPGNAAGARVGIITYDRALQFYDARGAEEGRSVSMCIVPDVNEAFLPLGGNAFFLSPPQAVAALENVLEVHKLVVGAGEAPVASGLPQSGAKAATRVESALGAALTAIKTAFEPCGGKAFVVAGSLPSFGPCKLERRGGAVGGGEEREMALLRPATQDYEIMGCELAEVQASVDMFLAPASAYMDAATLMRLPRACGGRSFFFSNFDPVRDGASLHRSLCTAVGSVRAFESLLRVRTSPGLETTGEFVGHFGRPQRGDDVSGPVLDATSSLALELSVVSKLLTDSSSNSGGNNFSSSYGGGSSLFDEACVQTAILYTDPAGSRRIRVHTVFANKTTVLGDVFKFADVDAVSAFFAKKAASAVLGNGTPLSKACVALVEKTSQSLFVYRKHCTSAPISGQLILPEALKVLPVMMLGLVKSSAFRPSASTAQASEAVSLDERVAALSFLTWASPADIAAVCYPRVWALHKLDDKAGLPLPPISNPVVGDMSGLNPYGSGKTTEPLAMPNTILLSSEVLDDDGVLLMENGMRLVVWVGTKANPQLVNDVIAQIAGGRLAIRAETAGSAQLVKSVGDAGKRIAGIVQRIVTERSGLSQPQVVIRQAPGAGGEAKFVLPLLVEDKPVGGGYSYMEFLKHVHKRVMDKLANESAQNEMQTWEMLNHGY